MTQTSLAQLNGSPIQGTSRVNKMKPGRILLYAILTLALIYYAIPLLLVISTSLKTSEEIRVGTIFTLPQSLTWEEFRQGGLITMHTRLQLVGLRIPVLSPKLHDAVRQPNLSTSHAVGANDRTRIPLAAVLAQVTKPFSIAASRQGSNRFVAWIRQGS